MPSILVLGLVFSAAPARAADVMKTVQAELSGADLANFGVENLAGRMRITVGGTDRVTVTATVHAEDSALADAVRIERVTDGAAPATLRVRYPYAQVRTFRYEDPDSRWNFSGFNPSTSFDYDGRDVRVNEGRGTRLWADLEVRVPAGARRAAFRNLVGRIDADGLQGTLRFEVASADLILRRLDGDVTLTGSSGDLRASDLRGSFDFESSSGDCEIDGFDGGTFAFHSSSGDLVARRVRASDVRTETSSGDVTLSSADVEGFEADASSGDVALAVDGSRLTQVEVTTSSGDVRLRLPDGAAFDAVADQSSGDMIVGFSGGQAHLRRRHHGGVPPRHGRREDPGFDIERRFLDHAALSSRASALDADDLLEPRDDLDEVRGVLDHFADRLVGSGDLVEHAGVLAALDALGLRGQVLPREAAAGLAAATSSGRRRGGRSRRSRGCRGRGR